MNYKLVVSSGGVRDIEEVIFYKERLGKHTDNILVFKKDVLSFIKKLEISPKTDFNLSDRVGEEINIKYSAIDDYILFYEIKREEVKVLRLLPARANWMNIILGYS